MKLKSVLFTSAVLAAVLMPVAATADEVRGTVADADNTVAVRAAQVRIIELDRSVATKRDGSF
ncbi:hypothetical protein INR77_06360 [Erythrobacter sp. SCSIO 43205]|uniref:hypothetical protein n=1 Tax=Erythrobacter sp. SCSIO 43205 TaxID=2779361 RepID=UPI001CA8034C|nr:hypothetical protein [Erythrobacter sp. SCSIO 43205]UAB79295.1 hypothetical protein INR77_06360 [Erythrobacter sp. SCSIO 43205]